MSEELNNQVSLRKYLLGLLDEAQTKEIEESLVLNEEYFQEFQIVEAEIIQDFVDETLSLEEKKAFEENFIITEDRREQINFARALRKFVDKKPKLQLEEKPSFFELLKSLLLSPIPAAAIVLLVVGISIFVWWNYSQKSEVLVALNKSQKNERPTEARITDFDYAPKTEGTRGNNNTENLDLVFAKSRATEAVLKNPTAENYHELGRVYLAEKGFDEAIKQFEKAVKLNPNISKLNNDLGVALMEKGRLKEEGRLELFARANESIEKSIELDKNLKEAYFNRALVIELLNLPNQAKEAWENYLKLDSTSKWADEARQRLQKLEANKPISKTKEEILKEFLEAKKANDTEKAWQVLSRNREMITGKLIPQQLAFLFVDAKSEGDETKAKETLEALVYAGRLEEEKAGDLFWRDLANYYVNVPNDRISSLKQAQDAVREGYELRFHQAYESSLGKFNFAKILFLKSENFVDDKVCDYWIAQHLFQLNRLSESNKIYLNLSKLGETQRYKWLATQAHVRLAYAYGSDNNYLEAIKSGNQVLKYTKETNDQYNKHRAFSILADEYKNLGRYSLSLNYSKRSLEIGNSPETSQRQKWLDYEVITNTFREMGFYYTSIIFQKEAIKVTQENKDKHNEQVSNVYLANISMLLNKYSDAENFINESIRIAEHFPDKEVKKKSLAHAKLQHGILRKLEERYDEAIVFLNEAEQFYDNSEFHLEKYNLHKEKLLTFRKIRDDEKIRSEIQNILNIFRKYRKEILQEQNRNTFFDKKQDIYDVAVDYEFSKGNYSSAIDYLEESRSRSLLDLQKSDIQIKTEENQPEIIFSSNFSEPLKTSQIQAEIPENSQLLEYCVLPDKVLIWVIKKNSLSVAESEMSINELQDTITKYLELVTNNTESDEQLKLSRNLYQKLITPIKDHLDENQELLIIPDKILFRLPFAALLGEKYLLEEFRISYSTSANVFLNCTKKAQKANIKNSENLLSIGNPTFNQGKYGNSLKLLPLAKQEAIEIARYYENSVILTEREATKENVSENLKAADIVHFAGHYVVDEKSPLLSSLILAESENLANYEIISKSLSHIRLIVLSACETGIEGYYQGEGMIGSARTFLAAGVPLVVASQWSVDSEATKELMINFHLFRKKENFSTTEALRQSQLKLLRSEKFNQPYYWAAFVALGSYTQF